MKFKMKKLNGKKAIMPILVAGLLLGACDQIVQGSSTSDSTTTSSEQASTSSSVSDESNGAATDTYGTYEDEDIETSYVSEEAQTITLSDDGTEAVDGVTVDGSTVTITQAGTYVIEGSLSDG